MELLRDCLATINFGANVLLVVLWRLERSSRLDAEKHERDWKKTTGADQYETPQTVPLYPRRRGK